MLQLVDVGVKSCRGQESFLMQTTKPALSCAQLDMHCVPVVLSQGKVAGE